MSKKYDYKIFPTTLKARLLLGLALLAFPIIGLSFALLLGATTYWFETGVWVTFENETSESVTVVFEGERVGDLAAYSEKDLFLGYKGLSDKTRRIEVLSERDGRVLLDLKIGRPGLSERDWRIVIGE